MNCTQAGRPVENILRLAFVDPYVTLAVFRRVTTSESRTTNAAATGPRLEFSCEEKGGGSCCQLYLNSLL